MQWFQQIAWFPLCAGVTAVGLVLSWLVTRRRGAAAGIRAASWSLLPLAAYLTGVIPLLWDLGTRVANWVVGFVINPLVWAGIALAGVSVVGFVVSGTMRGRKLRRQRAAAPSTGATGAPETPDSQLTGRTKPAVTGTSTETGAGTSTGKDEDFADVEEILRRRGISPNNVFIH